MCSELFRIPYEWGGVPIFGFGLLLALWTVASLVTLLGVARRHGWSAETWSAVPVLLLLGAAIVLLPRIFPGGLPIRGYGVMLLIGISAGVGMAVHRGRQGGLAPELIISLAVWLVISGVIGARLFYVVQQWNRKFAGNSPRDMLLEIVNIPEGGLVIYGGFFGAAVGFSLFVRKHKLPWWAMADLIAPSFMIGLALGRVGCLLNGCCFGGQTDWPWAVTFPSGSPPYADQAAHGELHGLRLDTRGGNVATIAEVEPGSAADVAGLREGDVVDTFNGTPINSSEEAMRFLSGSYEAPQVLQLTLQTGKTVRLAPPARSRPVHPTQVYSAIDAALLGWLLWTYYPFRRRDGECLSLMLTIHPMTRFLLEVIRTDEPAVFGTGLSISQNVSIALLACAGLMWWHLSRQPRGVIWPLVAAGPKRREASRR